MLTIFTINEAGQKWFFDNIVFPYLNSKIRLNWDYYKDAWFQDIEQCVMDTYPGDDIIYEIHKQFALDKESFTFHIHENFVDKYFDKRVIDETN